MAGVEVDSSLLSQCLDFCQALARQGHAFNLSVAIGASFTFSLDTRSKDVASQVTKKKASPSTLRRNTKRREEYQLAKQRRSSPRTSGDPVSAAENLCDQCEYVAASEKGLRQHIRMKHKEPRPAERIRSTFSQPPLVVSPIKEQRRVEVSSTREENPPSANGTDCTCSNSHCCDCNHDHSCECYKSSKLTSFCDCEDVSGLRCRLR